MIVQQWWKATTEDKTGKDVTVTYNTIKLVYGDAATETKPTETKPTETKPTETKPAEELPAVTKYGDVNNDGSVDIMDVISVNKLLLGIGDPGAQGKANADVNADKQIDSDDALNILKRVVEMLSDKDFPVK